MPRVNPALGDKLGPDIDEAARAMARRQRWKIVPEGAWAANLIGLSTQVPSKTIYLTDGPNYAVPIGRRTIYFKHARPKVKAGLEGKVALVVQALRPRVTRSENLLTARPQNLQEFATDIPLTRGSGRRIFSI